MTGVLKSEVKHPGRVILIVLVLGVLWLVGTHHSTSTTPTPTASAHFSARVTNFKVLPGNYVRVYYHVVNSGNAVGSPTCEVKIQPTNGYGDPLSGYGVDAMAGTSTVGAKGQQTFYMDIVVSDNDAHFVTSRSMIKVSNC